MITVVFETNTIAVDVAMGGSSRIVSNMPPPPKEAVKVIRWFDDGYGVFEWDSEVHGRADVEYFKDKSVMQPFLDAYDAAKVAS